MKFTRGRLNRNIRHKNARTAKGMRKAEALRLHDPFLIKPELLPPMRTENGKETERKRRIEVEEQYIKG